MHKLFWPRTLSDDLSVRLVLLIELSRDGARQAAENSCVGRERQRHVSQFAHSHPGRHDNRRDLRNLDSPFANDVATEHLVRRAVDNQFAKAERPPVDDGARCRVEMDRRRDDIVLRLRFGAWSISFDQS